MSFSSFRVVVSLNHHWIAKGGTLIIEQHPSFLAKVFRFRQDRVLSSINLLFRHSHLIFLGAELELELGFGLLRFGYGVLIEMQLFRSEI